MATRGAVRVELNRRMFDEITLAAADGLFEMAKAVVTNARVPDAPPYGRGLVERGGALAYVNGKQVDEFHTGGTKRTRIRWTGRKAPIVAYGGFDFPAHLLEYGTVKMSAHPFLTPSLMATIPDATEFVRLGLAKRAATRDIVKGLRVAQAAGDTVKARALGRAIRRIERLGR